MLVADPVKDYAPSSIADSGVGSSIAPSTQRSVLQTKGIDSDEWSDDEEFDQLASQIMS